MTPHHTRPHTHHTRTPRRRERMKRMRAAKLMRAVASFDGTDLLDDGLSLIPRREPSVSGSMTSNMTAPVSSRWVWCSVWFLLQLC